MEDWVNCRFDTSDRLIEKRTDTHPDFVFDSASDAKWDMAESVKAWIDFRSLVQEWYRERGATSSITKMATCYPYQRIIAMGPRVIPLILDQLDDEGDDPDMWFWALQVLTGVNPVPEAARGDLRAMAKIWLEWASEMDAR
jgi:hypothetical protein